MNRYSWIGFLLVILVMSGCYDISELEQKAYVVAVGIDATEKKGQYEVTFQIANPEVGTTQTAPSTEEKPEDTITIVAPDFISARNTANSFVTRELSLDHTKVLISSEELARSGELLNVVEAANRDKQLRRGVQIIISREKASEFLANNQPAMETRPHKYFQFMLERGKETGLIPDADIHRFYQITEGDADLFLGIYATSTMSEEDVKGNEDQFIAGQVPQLGEKKTQFIGSAVFKEGVMIDALNGEETRIALILDNTLDMEEVIATYPDPKDDTYRISARYVQKEETKVKITYVKDGTTRIKIHIPFQLRVAAIPSLHDYSNNKENQQLLKTTIEEKFSDAVEKLIKKTQQEYESEPFYWSLYVRHHFNTIAEYEEADWHNTIYPNAEIVVNCELKSIRFGKLFRNPVLGEVRD